MTLYQLIEKLTSLEIDLDSQVYFCPYGAVDRNDMEKVARVDIHKQEGENDVVTLEV